MKYLFLCGCPGSGKSTWAKKFIQKSGPNWIRINRDDFRRSLFPSKEWPGYVEGKNTEVGVSNHIKGLVENLSKQGCNIVDDNTNLNQKYFGQSVDFVKSLGYEVEIKEFFDVPLDKLIKRNLQREWSVPESVIHDMYRRQVEIQGRLIKRDPTKKSCILVDIDGTIADMGKGESWGRGAFEWDKVGQDRPRQSVIDVVLDLSNYYHIFFLSGRDGVAHDDTFDWLEDHVIYNGDFPYGFTLKLRDKNDMRHDSIVKEEMIRKYVLPSYNIKFAIDDRNSVVNNYRAIGIECWQVNYGNF